MAMNEEVREEEIKEDGSSIVEIEEETTSDEVEASTEEKEETRTNVRDDSKASDGDEELASFSDNVQRRINQLTAKRKQASEEAQAAYQYAQQKESENQKLKQRLGQLDKGYMSEYEGRVVSQETQAKRAYADAHESGDVEKMAEAQSAISQIAIEKERLRIQKARAATNQEQQQQQQQFQAQQAQQAQQVQQPPVNQAQEDPKLKDWLSKNEWFGKDRVMTRAAQAIHEQLVLEEAFDPSSQEYYSEIDKRLRVEIPNKFTKDDKKNAQAITPSSGNGRSLKSGRKKSVELTPGQVAFAKKMRIPLDTYAKEVAKLENRRD
jgi:hypothetical protein|tara:strand:+ start:369 stop:1334 length:966 start_codon:yes stop_codon:yes gene_type:complete